MKAVSEEEMERRQVKVICEVKKVEQAINPEKFSSWKKIDTANSTYTKASQEDKFTN